MMIFISITPENRVALKRISEASRRRCRRFGSETSSSLRLRGKTQRCSDQEPRRGLDSRGGNSGTAEAVERGVGLALGIAGLNIQIRAMPHCRRRRMRHRGSLAADHAHRHQQQSEGDKDAQEAHGQHAPSNRRVGAE